ncbi:unnamed protein product [Ectocarpus fasciculatus]
MFLPGQSRRCAVGGVDFSTPHRLAEGFHTVVATPAKMRGFFVCGYQPARLLISSLTGPNIPHWTGHGMSHAQYQHASTLMLPTPTVIVHSSAQVLRRLVTETPLTVSRDATPWVDRHQIPA